jgi:hypothetical protein
MTTTIHPSRRLNTYERKPRIADAEGHVEKSCLRCGLKFQSPLQKGRPIYWLCAYHRGAE